MHCVMRPCTGVTVFKWICHTLLTFVTCSIIKAKEQKYIDKTI